MSKADQKGRHHLHIELTPEEYRQLTEKPAQCGLSKRAFILRLLEGREVRACPSREIKKAIHQIHRTIPISRAIKLTRPRHSPRSKPHLLVWCSIPRPRFSTTWAASSRSSARSLWEASG